MGYRFLYGFILFPPVSQSVLGTQLIINTDCKNECWRFLGSLVINLPSKSSLYHLNDKIINVILNNF